MTTRTPKLSDMQLILLATACQRDDGSLLPPPDSIGDQAERIRKAVTSLIKRALAEEIEVTDIARSWREEGDCRLGVVITDAGRAIIATEEAVEPAGPTQDADVESPPADAEPDPEPIVAPDVAAIAVTPPAPSDGNAGNGMSPKIHNYGPRLVRILELMERPEGASLGDMVAATGLLPHSVRAALSGFRKAQITITREKQEQGSVYRIVKENA